jgi:hypothetical protein
MSRAILAVLLVALLIPLFCAGATASQITLTLEAMQVVVQSPAGVLPLDQGVAVSGQILVKVQRPAGPPGATTLYLDDQPALITSDPEPRLSVDTHSLADGDHQLRVETADLDGAQLASAGSVLLSVANAPGALHEQVAATALQPAPEFSIVTRKVIPREVVWFNGREGDLEQHGFRRNGQIYITTVDLFRHIGGAIVWGPTSDWIEMHRNDLTVRIVPGSRQVYINGQPKDLGAPIIFKDQRTYVPVQALCAALGLPTAWNADEGRLYVTFRP